ncbi:hypothetical protein GQX74_011080 [Glossina fuscipes]|nr:hypothetical protein GQX74_011080 [Glossina fuscipes]
MLICVLFAGNYVWRDGRVSDAVYGFDEELTDWMTKRLRNGETSNVKWKKRKLNFWLIVPCACEFLFEVLHTMVSTHKK